ncbi:MAG: putative toxin-antitoxin system toxin component, PIN family [Ardenticatenaceae bacterium]|nr:putative toxin-antitoxin system toxin component, PIN family [Ardenticatenaceae bacterium]
MSLRVVLDTSSLISFVLTTGDIMSQIVFAWRTEEFALITSWQTRAELNEVLDRPKIRALAKEPIERLKREVAKFSLFVDGADQISGVCRDPNDDKFLACAVAGKAHYLVSSDKIC